jgi:FixJ family two-component response regulator
MTAHLHVGPIQKLAFDVLEGVRTWNAGTVSHMGELRKLIYLIDDEASVVKSLSRLLRLYDFDVHGSHAAETFLAAYQPDAHCCVILDLILPRMDGLALQQEIYARTPGRPILFLSGRANVPRSVEAMKAGAMDVLTKPVDASVLIPTVRAALAEDLARHARMLRRREIAQRWARLTLREQQVVVGVCSGLLNKQICHRLGITEKTVKVHRAHAMVKLDVKNMVDLVKFLKTAPDLASPALEDCKPLGIQGESSSDTCARASSFASGS